MEHFKFYGSATVGTRGQIVIPAEARDEYQIKEGDKVVIMKAPMHKGLMVLKADVFENHMAEMQAHFASHMNKRDTKD